MHLIVTTEQSEVWNGGDGLPWPDHQERGAAASGGFNVPLFAAAAVSAARPSTGRGRTRTAGAPHVSIRGDGKEDQR